MSQLLQAFSIEKEKQASTMRALMFYGPGRISPDSETAHR